MHQNCPECQRLWQAYALAIRSHIRLEYKLRDGALEGDLNQIQDIAQEVDQADLVRSNFREAIRRHAGSAHARTAAAEPHSITQ